MLPIDYDKIWSDVWGDMQIYGPVHRHHRRIFHGLLRDIPVAEIQTIADAGCGEGSNLLFLKQIFPRASLFGFDLSETALARAKKNLSAAFQQLNIEKSPLPGSYDLVICSDVVEHLDDDKTALEHIYQATRKYALVASVQGRMRTYEKSIGHVRSYAYGELPDKMQTAGFTVSRTVSWGFPFYSPLYRDLFNYFPVAEQASHGNYGSLKKLVCRLLYAVFNLNRSDRGDIIFVFARK